MLIFLLKETTLNEKFLQVFRASHSQKVKQTSTVSGVLPLPVLVQFEDVQEDLAGQAAITAAPIQGEKRWRGLQWGQAAAGGSHWVQRRPRVPATGGLATALHRQVTAAVTEQKHAR